MGASCAVLFCFVVRKEQVFLSNILHFVRKQNKTKNSGFTKAKCLPSCSCWVWDPKIQWNGCSGYRNTAFSSKGFSDGSVRKSRCGLKAFFFEYTPFILTVLKPNIGWDRRCSHRQLAKRGPTDNVSSFPKLFSLSRMWLGPLPEVAIPTATLTVLVQTFPSPPVGTKGACIPLVFLRSLGRRPVSGPPHKKLLS